MVLFDPADVLWFESKMVSECSFEKEEDISAWDVDVVSEVGVLPLLFPPGVS